MKDNINTSVVTAITRSRMLWLAWFVMTKKERAAFLADLRKQLARKAKA